MPTKNDTALWAGLIKISHDSTQTLQAQIRQAIVAAVLDRQIAAVNTAQELAEIAIEAAGGSVAEAAEA